MKKMLLLQFCSLLFSVNISAKTIYFVKADGTGDGTTWANAASNIQTMLDQALSGDEVWVAKGTYYPTTQTISSDSRSKTVLIKTGVSLYGGFAGTESAISQRTLADLDANGKIDSCELVNKTILSGNIDGVADTWVKTINTDGLTWGWTVTGNEGNCYHVVTCNNSSKINGFSIIGGNANVTNNNYGGGVYSNSISSNVTNCTITNCSATSNGGGLYSTASSQATNCMVTNCSGSGIYSFKVTNCTVSNCSASNGGGGISSSYAANCMVSNCSASSYGGGIYASSSVTNCNVSNCSASSYGGGIYTPSNSYSLTYITNCTVTNCSTASDGGGIYSATSSYDSSNSYVTNCIVSNCSASRMGGGIRGTSSATSVYNCAASNNNTNGTIGSGLSAGTQSYCISPDISSAYIHPTSFIGIATTDAQKSELLIADWHLIEGSPCINVGTSTNVSSTILLGNDLDNNPRVAYSKIDIGAYEYTVPIIQMPVVENFNNLTNFENSAVFYRSANLNTLNDIKWTIANQKADFNRLTNLTSTYSQPIFTYQIDATKSSKVFLRYDMYFQAYSGSISIFGTEKLNIEFSTDFVTWKTIATYSNASGTIASQTYKYDISTLVAGKTFFIRFNANGENSNRIEKWEIDNVIINVDALSAVNTIHENKYNYSVNKGVLNIGNLGQASFVQLFDVNGRLLSAENINSQMFQFILPKQGVYVLKVSSDSGIESNKIVW